MKKIILPLAFTIGAINSQTAIAQSADPGSGNTLLMIGQIFQDEYVDFINQVGLTPMGASFYGTFYTGTFEQGSGSAFIDYIENNQPGSVVVAAMSFKDNPGGGGYANVNAGLQGTVNGAEDGDIDAYINIFNSYPNTRFLLRVGYEVNSTFIGMDANLYISAYRRVVDRIRNAGVSNVEFVYHPVRLFDDVTAFYPGASYVDWFALSIFNNDVCMANVSFNPGCVGIIVEPDIDRAFNWARDQGLSLLIAESTAQAPLNENSTDFNEYLRRLDSMVKQYDVGALAYINSDWRNFDFDANFTDARIQKFSATQDFWLDNFGNNTRYIYYNQTPAPTPAPTPGPTPAPTPTDTCSNPSANASTNTGTHAGRHDSR